ncbi:MULTISPECIES: cellulose binding domain-containing protein [unclassified Arcicella]|uniref:cellulose binding domain-containing protein n=1 Tax=unclassified Arcicella TaxID=2644986 RepID=UPI0028671E8B|nr:MULTISPECIES: cellulose binding domain-containing protein [unclassified Arcicella]MDR6562223.1 autotransporter-associated beta strand protein [Arcicella sp. BE51]MDR6812083.1 autotransporter-associated beta strand protein [Arcicella sp. BE140]MDR6823394.1 autotransporter-associated beta strand protein [Arcicella sp. BE139]
MKKYYSNFIFGLLLLIFVTQHQLKAQKTFVHPGIPFTQYDLNQLKANITQEPWLTGYNALKNDYRSQLSFAMRGPFANVTRSPDLNNSAWKIDMVAIHNLTFMYVFTGDAAYAAKATQILDAWAVTNTTWGGGENMLDIGDYAPYFITAADILKSTYSGWTADNTAHVNNYFANVLYPASWVPNPLRDCNKGAIQLQIALGIAAFLDDEVKWNQAIESYRMEAGAGLRNSIPSGQVGDTGRDDHWFGQAWALAWDGEVAFKQGNDMFAEMNNRLLAIGELYNHYAIDPTGLTFTPYGGYSVYWTSGWGIATGSRKQHPFNNIIQGAYSLRKGIPTPYTDQMRALVGEGAWSFLYLKSSDNSTATPMTPIVYPSESAVPSSYFSNTDIGVTGIKGSVNHNAGTWTVKGAGTAPANSSNFTFKPVKGDVAIVAKIENNSVANAVSGLMIRESLSTTSNYVSINFNPPGTINVSGVGATAANSGYTHYSTSSSWWLKLERVGNRVFAYHSHDGVTWTNIALFIIPLPTDTYIGFYTASKNTSALNTATFTNVAVNNTFAVGSPEINSTTSAVATVGTAFNFNVTAVGTPTTFAATGLPTGLSINATTGAIIGTPTTVGKSVVLLEATNASGTGKAALVIDVISNQAPIAINSLAVNSANSSIKLTWTATDNATSYSVKRSLTSGGPYTTIQANITGTSFTDPSPAYEVNNYYVVTALVGENESAVSNEVFGSVPPAVPTNVVATNQNGQVNLTWDSADGASTYKVKRATISGGPYTEIASVATNTYTDNNVTNGTAYYYVITSKGTNLESGISSEVFGNPGTNSLTWNETPTSNTFNVSANWLENVVPINPAILTFKDTETNTLSNDLTGLVASRILFANDAVNYTIAGNGITLKSDLVNNSSQSQVLTMPINVDGQLNVNAKNNSIELSGVVSGTGSLLKTGSSALVMSGANTYTGNTIIRGTKGYAWGSTDGIQVLGIGTGTSGSPINGPLGTGKIILEGGALYTGTNVNPATLYNDIEVTAGNTGYFYERQGHLNLYGRLLGSGTFINDGSDNYATISLYGNNSSFTGTFITKLRSGNHRMAFMVPESGSANAAWLLDAVGVDCHRIMYSSGALEFGSLSGRGGIRCNVAGTPIIRIGALNTNTNFSGTIANAAGTLSVEKVGTGTLTFSGNSTFGGTTTILNGTFLLNNSNTTGTYSSQIIAKSGSFGGTGKSTAVVTIGTNDGTGALLVPGTDGTIGTFTTSALLALNSDATYKVDINNVAVSSDKVIVGNAQLNQAKLVINNVVTGTIPLGSIFTILDNTGTSAIIGTFKDLPEMALVNVGGYNFRITYKGGTGNDIQLLDNRATYTNSTITGVYYIKIAGSDSLLTKNTSSNSLTFGTLNSDKNLQRWRVTKETNGRYKISSFGDAPSGYNNHIDENAQFGTEVYDSTLHTMNIYRNGIRYAIQKTGNGGYWYVDRDTVRAQQGNAYSNVPYSFPFELVLDIYYPLDAKLDEAKAIRDAAQTSTTQEVGKYPVDAKQTFSNVIATTLARYNTLVTADQVNAEILILTNAINEFKKTIYYSTNLLANGNYFIKIPNTESYWTKNTTNVPVFEALNTDRTNQIWNITKQSNGRYKITHESAPNSTYLNYINEGAQFGKNVYDATWNTMSVYFNGTTYAIQKAQKAGYGYWYINEANILSTSSTTSSPPTSFPILLIPVASLQVITFNPLQTKTVGDVDFDGGATVNSGLPVAYTSSNLSVATIVNGKIHIVGAGTTNITATQVGNATYTAATPVTQTLTVLKRSQSITFNALANKYVGDEDFETGAITSSNLTVVYTSSNPTVATIVSGKIHIIGAGTTTITASQAGNATYLSATPVTQSLIVLKKSQSITFANIPNKILGDADFEGGAVASSNLGISYTSSNPAVATIVNGKIHLVGTGTSTITASQNGNQIYNPAIDVTQTLTVIATLKVKYQDGDNNLTNNQIKPNLIVYNEGTSTIPYNELTLRYWVTPENYAGINTWIDYAQLGNGNVKMKYVALSSPRNGAFGYIEYSFEASAGNLVAGGNSGQIQSRFANSNWSNLAEGDDYSYTNSSVYAYNEHITMYRNGVLVWGVEPVTVPSSVNLKVYTETKASATTNTISTYLKINNEGNVPVAYGDVKVRYWFTKEGTANLNYYLDYAALGNANIESGFVTLNPVQTGANTYLQLGVKASLGTFYPSSSTGNIQYRIGKTDWSNFNQADDYSFNINTTMTLNDKVTVYYQGQLIYGTEPSVIANGRISADKEESSSGLEAIMLGNPIAGDRGEVLIKGTKGLPLTISLTNINGLQVLSHSIEQPSDTEQFVFPVNNLSSGVYLLKVVNEFQAVVIKVIK